ncbi:uncharacterized protein A1O5_00785 [Cladophialophora psammophila CBS 110553]|uniref:3-hydroxybutyrate dehydrogenase n=1 Tax=Cladophialophora psammophila CBS 110553 TaxID=1182543 RepID=W9X727_9EURO|nr:uncharacterized protein A1O5_00785 [Cladophialophora psammophila CBS 110553]EXJ76277.1 hypothetical protein A1O5_00785 [Cladophialophora psammophila CBS 110553]
MTGDFTIHRRWFWYDFLLWSSTKNNQIRVVRIGFACAHVALSAGAKAVIIADLRLTPEGEKMVTENEHVIFEKCDVAKWKDLQNVIDGSITHFGDVPDIYIASAGVFEPPYSNFWDDPEGLDANGYKAVDINVNHPIKLTRLAMRALLGKSKRGVVAIVASIAGYSKQYPAPIYSATKHALVGFTRSLGDADALQGVRVVAICPGIVATPIWTTGTPGSGERFGITDEISITPSEVANALFETVKSAKYPGGTIMEVSKLGTRVIPEWHIAPVGEIDGKMAEGSDIPSDAIQRVLGSILQVTEHERGALLQKAS